MNLYERIRNRRNELNMSQDELAAKLGYKSRSTIAKIEAGINDIPQSKIDGFADALQTTAGYLMGLTKNSKSYQEIDRFESVLKKLTNILESSGYSVDYDNTDLMLIYDKDKKLIKTIREEDIVKKYENAVRKNSSLLIDDILNLVQPTTENDLMRKYNSLDDLGKHTVNTILEMEYKRCTQPYHLVNAAHEIEGATEEDKAHDDAIMDGDDF